MGLSYKVPEDWESDVANNDNKLYYPPQGGLLMVSSAALEGSVENKTLLTAYINAMAGKLVDYKKITLLDSQVAGKYAAQHEYSSTLHGQKNYHHLDFYFNGDGNTNLYSVMFAMPDDTYQEGLKIYQKIIDSIEIGQAPVPPSGFGVTPDTFIKNLNSKLSGYDNYKPLSEILIQTDQVAGDDGTEQIRKSYLLDADNAIWFYTSKDGSKIKKIELLLTNPNLTKTAAMYAGILPLSVMSALEIDISDILKIDEKLEIEGDSGTRSAKTDTLDIMRTKKDYTEYYVFKLK